MSSPIKSTREKYLNNPTLFKSLIWDYNLSPQQFFDIVDNKNVLEKFNQDWAIGRVLENVNYYDALDLINPLVLLKRWDFIRDRIFNKEIKKGYDYILRRNSSLLSGGEGS